MTRAEQLGIDDDDSLRRTGPGVIDDLQNQNATKLLQLVPAKEARRQAEK